MWGFNDNDNEDENEDIMKKKLYICILGCVLGGCSFLDREPHSLVPETYFSTETELRSFLLGVYSPLMNERFYGNYYPLYIAGGDDLTFYQRSTPPTCMMCANTNSGDSYILELWRLLYQGINRANMLLENVDRNPSIAKATRDAVRAEALFLRAFYYFHLVQGWGDVPFLLESTQSVQGQDRPRKDKEVIYDQIVKDMEAAIQVLPSIESIPTPETISRTAAEGILARVWLFRAGECYRDGKTPDEEKRKHCFSEAHRWALNVREEGKCGLVKPYSRVFADYCEDLYNSTGTIESLWEVAETGNNSGAEAAAGRIGNVIGLGLGDNEVGITSHVDEVGLANPGYSYGFAYASLKLYEMYELNQDTARCDWNIAPFTYTTQKTGGVKSVTGRQFYYGKKRAEYVAPAGYTYTEQAELSSSTNKTRCVAKYRRELEKVAPKNKNYTPINFPILRYSDVLLMLAEAENELNGPTALAYECLNAVRLRADVDGVADLDKDGFRQKVKDERAMELCFEALRRWDLIRWGEFVPRMREMQGYVNMTGWSPNYLYASEYYNVGPHYTYFPIPDTEMSLNKAITRNNPGW